MDATSRRAPEMDREALIEQLRRAVEKIARLRSENDALNKELERLLRQQRGHGQRKKRRAQARPPATGAGPRRRRSEPPLCRPPTSPRRLSPR